MIDETLFDAEEKMEKAVAVAKDDLATIRTGRATPDHVQPDRRRLLRRADADHPDGLVQRPGGRGMAVIKPYDTSQLTRHREGDPRLRPRASTRRNDGHIIRVVVPAADRGAPPRVVKVARHKGEDAKVSIRNIRRKPRTSSTASSKDGEAGEDEVAPRREGARRTPRDQYVASVDELVKHKEAELLEV